MTRNRGFWIGVAAGWAAITFGVVGLLTDATRTHPAEWIRWFVGALVVHDLIVAPLVFLAARSMRSWPRAVRNGLIASAIVILVAYPPLRGYGRDPLNPSILPHDYPTHVAILVAGIWSCVGLAHLLGRIGRAHGDPDHEPDP